MATKTAVRAQTSKRKTTNNGSTQLKRSQAKDFAKKLNCTQEVLSSTVSYDGPLFRVYTDEIRENGNVFRRDVIRHDGSAVILALDDASKRDPLVVVERQYRHAAQQFLLEMPAGKLEEGEDSLEGAKRELLEETGFRAKRWRKLIRYFASPGFLGEWMEVYVAEGLIAGEAQPEDDERIEVLLMPFSELLKMIEAGKILDGKTLISVMLYDRHRRRIKKSAAKKK
jgi:ADP-ribose pyrophosphatase